MSPRASDRPGHLPPCTFMVAAAIVALSCGRDASDRRATGPAPAPGAPAQAPTAPIAPDVTPPSVPQGLEASASAQTAALSWTGSGDDRGVEGYEVFRGEERIARVDRPQASDTGLVAGRRYCWTVVAFDAAGNRSAPSAPACLEAPDVTPPSPPGGATAALSSPTEARVRWSPSTDDVGVAAYEVLRDDAVVATSRELFATVGRLAPARRYCLAVRAVDAAGNRSAPSGPACVTTPDVTPPTAPPRLAASARAHAVDLSWEPATDDVRVVRYEVVRDGKVVADTAATAASESGLRTLVRHCYTVRALDAAGNASPPSGPACATPPDLEPPSTPEDVVARAASDTVIELRWRPSTDDVGVVRYEAFRDGAAVANTAATATAIRGLRPAVEYCHTVRACDAAGNCSAPSRPACATTPDLQPPSRVANVVAKAESDRSISVRWSPSHDDVGVREYRVREGGRTIVLTRPDATSFLDDGLLPATRHCYTIVAADEAENASAPSEPACAVTPDLVPPTAPPRIVAYPRSGAQLALRWQESTDDVRVEGYEILRDGAVVATTQRTQALVQGLSPETEYCVAVRAFDPAGNRSPPSKACGRTASASAPGAPWDVRVERSPRDELVIRWDPSPNANVVYVVYWDGNRRGDRAVGTTPNDSFKVFGKAAAERHCYRVVARDESERESPSTQPICASVREVAARAVEGAAVPGAGGGQ